MDRGLSPIIEFLLLEEDGPYVPEEISLGKFIESAWHVLEPFTPYEKNWHIDYLAEHLQLVTAGDLTRLIINIAPRHMKSLLVSVMWPCWEWTFAPETRWLFASYDADLALKHSVDRRTLMNSEWYRSRWGRSVIFTPDQNQKGRFSNMRRGEMTAVSFGGRVTGLGGNRIVIDDPMNPRMADSELERETALNFYRKSLHNRLNQPDKDAMVLVMQRLHEEDLTGYLAEQDWTRIVIPTEAEQDETLVYPISGKTQERKEGELLWPERFTPAVIKAAKIDLGPMDYAAQHQQRPVPREGALVKDSVWRFYDWQQKPVVLQLATEVSMFVDTAMKDGQENDWSVAAVWALVQNDYYSGFPAGFYLLDLWRDKVQFGGLKAGVQSLWRSYPAIQNIVIEDKVSGTSLIQEFQNEAMPVIAFRSDVDKVRRLSVKTGYLEAGMGQLPKDAPWLPDFLTEHRNFPKGKHDDMVDTTTMMLHHFSARISGWGGVDAEEVQSFFQLAGN
jgi:predicted phage terminase large subunit-like protein